MVICWLFFGIFLFLGIVLWLFAVKWIALIFFAYALGMLVVIIRGALCSKR